jgi:EmrB/QacA subfamily drug resistance transporter
MKKKIRPPPGGEAAHGAAPARFSIAERLALCAILSGAFMAVLDFFIVIVALPSIQTELGASPATLGLIVAAYAAATAAGLVVGGRLGDRFGRKRVFSIGLACFTLASVGCGLAESPTALVALRVLQGLAGALLQPQVLALLAAGFSGAKRARAFAAYAMAMGVAGVSAQIVGGLLIEADLWGLGWRSCFLINLPIGLAGLLLAARAVTETPRRPDLPMDLPGSALIGAGLGLLVLALTQGREAGFPLWSLAALASAAACALAFVAHERRQARAGRLPLLPPALLARADFRHGVLSVLLFYSTVASLYFVLGLHLQQALGLTPLISGLAFGVLGAAFFVASMLGARTAPNRRLAFMVGGALLMASGHVAQLLAPLAGPSLAAMLPGLLAQGAGIGLVMAPLMASVLATAPAVDAGVAAGIAATMQQVGNALGVSVISAVYALANGYTLSLAVLAALSLALALRLWRAAAAS